MLHLDMARWVGTAPGTTTFSAKNGRSKNGMYGFGQPTPGAIFPTQAVLEPSPNSDSIRIALPPNQWATGPVEMLVNVPAHEKTMGPVPTDLQAQQARMPYMPVHRSWIANARGPDIYHLQGFGAENSSAIKWSIAASVISAVALATTTVIAVARYRKEHKRRR